MALFEVFEGTDGEFYWHLDMTEGDGLIIATGGQGYKTRDQAHADVRRVKDLAGTARITDLVEIEETTWQR